MGRQTWRSPFYLECGMTVLCFIGGMISIDKDLPSTEVDRRVDWIGAFLVTAGLVLIVFVLGQGEIAPQQWATPCKLYGPPIIFPSLTSFSSSFNIRYYFPSHRWRSPRHCVCVLAAVS